MNKVIKVLKMIIVFTLIILIKMNEDEQGDQDVHRFAVIILIKMNEDEQGDQDVHRFAVITPKFSREADQGAA
jgi:hypothetical protein